MTLASTNGKDYTSSPRPPGRPPRKISRSPSAGAIDWPGVRLDEQRDGAVPKAGQRHPANGSFTVAMAPNTIYTLSTTTGQQKGAYTPPAAAAFPFPYYENYDHYTDFTATGYRAYYHSDIGGGFELYKRADGAGNCLRQVVSPRAQSWAPEWNPYTIVGDTTWTNYQVSADVFFETTTGWAGIMGRVNSTGDGYGNTPNGYYMTLSPTGAWTFNRSAFNGGTTAISNGQATLATGPWHNLQLVFQGTTIKGLVDTTQVFSVTDTTYGKGNVGLATLAGTTAQFDLIVNTVGGATPNPTVFVQDTQNPADGGASSSSSSGGVTSSSSSSGSGTSSSSSSGHVTSSSSSAGGVTSSSSNSGGIASSSSSSGGETSSSSSSGGEASSSSSSGHGGSSSGVASSSGSSSGTESSSGSAHGGAGGTSNVGTTGAAGATAGGAGSGQRRVAVAHAANRGVAAAAAAPAGCWSLASCSWPQSVGAGPGRTQRVPPQEANPVVTG